jgi:hypothetical protein
MNKKILLFTMMLAGTSVNAIQEFQSDLSDSDGSVTASVTEDEDEDIALVQRYLSSVTASVTEEEDEEEDEGIALVQRRLSTDQSFRDQMFFKAMQHVSRNPSLFQGVSEEDIAARVEEIVVTMALIHVLPTPSVPKFAFSRGVINVYRISFSIAGEIVGEQYMYYRGDECIDCRWGQPDIN